MDSTTMRLIAGVIAVLFGVVIFMRRRTERRLTPNAPAARARTRNGNPITVFVVGFRRPA